MASFGLSADDAWNVLVEVSQHTNTKVHCLAEDLVSAVNGDPLPDPLRQQVSAAVTEVLGPHAPTIRTSTGFLPRTGGHRRTVTGVRRGCVGVTAAMTHPSHRDADRLDGQCARDGRNGGRSRASWLISASIAVGRQQPGPIETARTARAPAGPASPTLGVAGRQAAVRRYPRVRPRGRLGSPVVRGAPRHARLRPTPAYTQYSDGLAGMWSSGSGRHRGT